MKNNKISLIPLVAEYREQFMLDNQRAFKHGALLEFGERDNHLDSDGEIISRVTIEKSLDAPNNNAYRIISEGRTVGGVVLEINTENNHNHLDLLFIKPEEHGKGIGYAAWNAVEALYPETTIWETCIPYFEKRNIHFYVNKCGFSIVEFYNELNPEPTICGETEEASPTEMFRFIK